MLELVRPKIEKQYKVRAPILAEERLAVTLRYLASGDSKQSISFQYKMGKSTINGIIDEVCDALWSALASYVKAPSTLNDWENIIKDFEEIWNMPHCLGAIDGKHVAMRKPENSGSLWHNYKGFFSLALLDVYDAKYKFSFIDIGQYGSMNDSAVLTISELGRCLESCSFFFFFYLTIKIYKH